MQAVMMIFIGVFVISVLVYVFKIDRESNRLTAIYQEELKKFMNDEPNRFDEATADMIAHMRKL